MYLNFVCEVDRLNSTVDGQRHYILSPISFDCISSYADEQEYGRQLAQASHHIEFVEYPKSLDSIAMHRENATELKEQGLFDEQRGGMRFWLPDGLAGGFYVTALSGAEGLGDIATMADMALQTEHLYLQFSVDVGFSEFEDNPHMPRPITFEMFCKGARMYVSKLPDVGLVRRHVP